MADLGYVSGWGVYSITGEFIGPTTKCMNPQYFLDKKDANHYAIKEYPGSSVDFIYKEPFIRTI